MEKIKLEDLQKHLSENTQIETVFFNANGDWRFHKAKGGYLTGYTRDQVLAKSFDGPVIPEAAVETAKKITPKKAAELIAAIEAATTAEEATAAAEGDQRATVTKALAAKLEELADVS